MQCALLLGPAAAKNKIGLDLWRWTNLTTYECDFETNATVDIQRTCTELNLCWYERWGFLSLLEVLIFISDFTPYLTQCCNGYYMFTR